MTAGAPHPGAWALKGAVLAYQCTLRPVLGCNCRFYPSCSDYALEALGTHGALRGGLASPAAASSAATPGIPAATTPSRLSPGAGAAIQPVPKG